MRLLNKRAVVTGGASGIGRAIVERFAQEGASVAVCDINAEACHELVNQLHTQGYRVVATVGDVSTAEDARRMVAEAVSFLGGLDILINNAGVDIKGTVVSITDEGWDRQIAVNLTGVYRMSKCAIPEMIKAEGGAIVNIGSVAGFLGITGLAAYGTSKGAVVQLTRNLAADFAPYNIRVNSVNPGTVDTPLLEHACRELAGPGGDWEAIRNMYAEAQLIKRVAQPSEIANAVLFLASDEASFITGTALMVDGGFSIKQ
ncbi:MAG: glucose 1-dehydrogenase [Acidobacteria bacterium]|nr:glucose 1-dehydrogenase [Acidobacteriota bacterium]